MSLSRRWDWQRAIEGAQAGDQIPVGLGSRNSMNQEQAQSRGAPSGSGTAPKRDGQLGLCPLWL